MQVRTFNLEHCKKMRDLDPMDIDTLVSVRGMIIRNGSIIPDMKQVVIEIVFLDFPLIYYFSSYL